MVGYASCTQSSNTSVQRNRAAALPEVQGTVQEAIMNAFLTGSDDAFDHLLEVWRGWEYWWWEELTRMLSSLLSHLLQVSCSTLQADGFAMVLTCS